MDPLENPYRPGAGTAPPALIGRDQLIEEFRVAIQRAMRGKPGKSVVSIGLRGVGKTVLLNRFKDIAEDEGFQVAYIEAPETGTLPQLLAVKLRPILLRLDRGPVERTVRKALGALKAFSWTLPDGTAIQLDIEATPGIADSGVLSEDLTDLLVCVGEAASARSTGVVIAIDEIQYLNVDELGGLIAAIHRVNQRDLPVVLVGAGLPQLPGLTGDAKSYAERLFEFPTIGSLSLGVEGEAAGALRIPARESGVDFDDDALEAIVNAAHGYPYFLQEWGHRVWNQAAESPITLRDVDSARPVVLDHLDKNFFLVRFNRLTPKEKEYLRAMAELGAGPHRSGDVAAALGKKVTAVGPVRNSLIKKGMVYGPSHGETAFTVPLFDEFLKRVMPDGSS